MFVGKKLLSKRYERGTCSEEGSRRVLEFDTNGGARIRNGNTTEETLSSNDINQLASGQSLPTVDKTATREMQFYWFRDSNGERLAIQEIVYDASNTKNYIRIWY